MKKGDDFIQYVDLPNTCIHDTKWHIHLKVIPLERHPAAFVFYTIQCTLVVGIQLQYEIYLLHLFLFYLSSILWIGTNDTRT